MNLLNHKIYAFLRYISVFLLLSFCYLRVNALSDTLRNAVLEKSRELIESNDENAERINLEIDSICLQSNLSDSIFLSFAINDIGEYLRQQGRQSSAIELFSMMAGTLEQEKASPVTLLRLYIPLGAAFEEIGMWSSAMEYYHRALSIAEEYKQSSSMARIYNNIGAAYFRRDMSKAEEYMQKALEINTMIGDRKEMALNYNNLAGIYESQELDEKALDYALRAIQLIDKEKDAYMYHFMQSNIASLYINTHEFYLAISYLKSAMNYQRNSGNINDLLQVYNMLAATYEKLGMTDSALFYYQTAEQDLPRILNSDLKVNTYTTLAHYYERKKDYKRAYNLLSYAAILKDSLVVANDLRRINDLERIYGSEQKLRENALVINEMQLNKLRLDRRMTAIAIALFVLVIIIIFLVTRMRLRAKLHKTKEQLAMQQIALSEKEKELQQIKEKELNKTIDQKNRELSSYALSYTKDNEFYAHICEELKQVLLELNPRDKQHKERLRKILTQLRQHCAPDNWQEFRYYFEQVHPSFYDKLDVICPGITTRQKRLCAMLYIGLSTKEISSITFREVRSIESARNRLRKKMEIPAEETINEFLSKKLSV